MIKRGFLILISLNFILQASSLKGTIIFGTVSSAVCKTYAEEVGGNVEIFSNMNVEVLKLAEKMGYTDNFQSYVFEINELRKKLQPLLLEKYGSKINIYNSWCMKIYKGYQRGKVQPVQ